METFQGRGNKQSGSQIIKTCIYMTPNLTKVTQKFNSLPGHQLHLGCKEGRKQHVPHRIANRIAEIDQ